MASKKPSRRDRIAQGSKRSEKVVLSDKKTERPVEDRRYSRLPSVWRLLRASVHLLGQQPGTIIGISTIYALLYGVFVQAGNAVGVQADDTAGLAPAISQIALGSGGSQTVQFLLFMIISLALIWTLRRASGGDETSVRSAFYQGMYPVIPALLVLCIGILQLMPLLIGSTIYQLAVVSGATASTLELILWTIGVLAAALLSLYWLVLTVIAFYIVTLPDMNPLRALRASRDLLRGRRWTVLRKMLALPLLLIALSLLLVVPPVLILPIVAPFVATITGALVLTFGHAYLYTLYKELMHEETDPKPSRSSHR